MNEGSGEAIANDGGRVRPTRVYLVEDHPVMQTMLRKLIEAESDFLVVGAATSAEEAIQELPHIGFDLLLVDLSLPGMSGDALVARLRDSRPSLKALIVSGHEGRMYSALAVQCGAQGYVMKDDPDVILAAARTVGSGARYGLDP